MEVFQGITSTVIASRRSFQNFVLNAEETVGVVFALNAINKHYVGNATKLPASVASVVNCQYRKAWHGRNPLLFSGEQEVGGVLLPENGGRRRLLVPRE